MSLWHCCFCPIYCCHHLWRGSVWSEHCIHLEMSPLALVCLLTTRGSLTYIGSYISGAKSTPLTLLENGQVSSRTWAMSWMFGHKGGWIASLRLFPSLFQMKIATIHYPAGVFQAHILWWPEGGQWIRFYKHCAGFLFRTSETSQWPNRIENDIERLFLWLFALLHIYVNFIALCFLRLGSREIAMVSFVANQLQEW